MVHAKKRSQDVASDFFVELCFFLQRLAILAAVAYLRRSTTGPHFMDIRFHSANKGVIRSDCLILPTFDDESASLTSRFQGAALAWALDSECFADHSGQRNEVTVCYGPTSSTLRRVILVGLGSRSSLTLGAYRAAIATAVRKCKALRLGKAGILLEDVFPVADVLNKERADVLQEAVAASLLAVYSCVEYKSAEAKAKAKKENDPAFFALESLTILHKIKTVPASLRAGVRLAEAEAAGVLFARDLVNAPANIMTPARMADEAVALAKRHGFGCRVLHKAEIAKLGMGAFLAVNEGAHKDPRFIILEHNPGGAKKRAPLVLVGKGITFDTGGISLKPAGDMHHMKGDMAGAAAVLGAFEAIGRFSEGVTHPVVGLIPCTENMPGGRASRPGDVVTTLAGKTVEILNTDAEGRLILCDALAYAQKNWTPLAIVDIATLTGACMVALGRGAAGLFTENAALCDAIASAGDDLGDVFWPMPLWERMREGLKSDVADLANIGPRDGGAISAAVFLQAFVEKGVPWAHLDMAGAGLSLKDDPVCPKGGTGFGVRTLFALARRVSDKMFK